MAHDAVQAKRATYEDLLRVPDTMVAEIIDGELIVSPRPASPRMEARKPRRSGPFAEAEVRLARWWLPDA
jgi:hypothetical protein